ncbi:hypothetical protein JCM10207_002989 [Rhodosporidiobolus poonsookiae]
MAPSRASSSPSSSSSLHLSRLAWTLCIAAALAPSTTAHPSPSPSLVSSPSTSSPSQAPVSPLSLPLFQRDPHPHHQHRHRKREHQQAAVREWAVRERGRLVGKYGAGEETLRKRAAEEEKRAEQQEYDEEKRKGRRKRWGDRRAADGEPDEDGQSFRAEGAGAAALERRQGGVGGALPLSSASSGSSSTRTALSVAGYGSSETSTSQVYAETATTTRVAGRPQETMPVGEAHMLNYDADLSYYAPVGIGVPAQYMNLILDTGSADLWLASDLCASTPGCSTTTPLFNTTLSRTALNMNTSFSVRYGKGSAQGDIWQDYVSFAGYNVSSQGFAVVEQVSEGILTGEISGLMGLGWQPLAASRVTPFWQNLYSASALPFPGFGVSLSRFIDVANASAIEPGGSITFGYLNASLYSSAINYVPIPSGAESYWVVQMDQVAVSASTPTTLANATSALSSLLSSLGVTASSTSTSSASAARASSTATSTEFLNVTAWSSGQGQYAAIDTGTTLIGGPSDVVARLYGQVEGAKAATGQYAGYWSYPCDVNVSVALTFGDVTYNMSHVDFNLGPFGVDTTTNRSTCLGAFFDLTFGSSSRISWVIGAAFLKNVYSVYRASPPSVGFALPYNSTTLRFPSFPSNSSDPAHDGNVTALPGGVYGPSADGTGATRTTLVAANTVTTAVQAGGTIGRVNGAARARAGSGAGGVLAGLAVAVAAWGAL